MIFLSIFLCTLLVLSILIIAVWLWFFIGIFDQLAVLVRIKVEEQVAVWRIESVARITKLEQQRLHDEHKT